MANQIIFSASISPPSSPVEVTVNGASSFTSANFVTVNSVQQYTLAGVVAGTYPINTVGMRAVGYPGTLVYNPTAIVVTGTAQTITPTSATPA